MSKNVGTLISAAIRPVDSDDPIASAYAKEIKGGLHTTDNVSDRNAIIFERREWGMMCYSVADDKTYQLTYNYTSTSIMDNNNWVEFSGSGGGSGSEWVDSLLSIQNSPPVSPSNGDRYMVGSSPSGGWIALQSGLIVQWNSVLSQWISTTPTDGMSLVVDNEDGAIYRYETYGGLNPFPLGDWKKERIGQIRDISFSSVNGASYSATSNPTFNSYVNDMIFLSTFNTTNTGSTVSLNINGMGQVQLKKPTSNGLTNFNPLDIEVGLVYNVIYDGTYFQLNRSFVNEDLFNVKYNVEPNDYIVVPQNYQYWVYADLQISGNLVNYGQVIIANGSMNITGGTFTNYGSLSLINLSTSGLTSSFNSTDTIDFTTQNTIYGLSVSAIVKDMSLTASKLDTGFNGGATAGYFLSVDNAGQFVWSNSTTGAGDGLSQNGGNLDVNVGTGITISGDAVTLTNTGVTAGVYGNSQSIPFFTVDSQGRITDVGTNSISLASGTITSVNAGFGLTGGGSSSSVTLDISLGNNSGLTFSNNNLSLDFDFLSSNLAGSGLSYSGGTLSVNVNSDSLEIINDTIRLKDTITGNRTFQDSVTVDGNLIVNGTVSYIQTETLLIEDNIITLNATFSGNPFLNAGIEVIRGNEPVASFIWNESTDLWSAGLSGSEVPIFLGAGTGLTSSGQTVSLNLTGIVGTGLTQNGSQISVINYSPFYQSSLSTLTSGNNSTTGITLSNTPSQYSRVQLFVNGQLQKIGDGTFSNVDCYFSNDGGLSALSFTSLVSGNVLYWNGVSAGFELDATDEIDIIYEY
jgi:hypothetical protein